MADWGLERKRHYAQLDGDRGVLRNAQAHVFRYDTVHFAKMPQECRRPIAPSCPAARFAVARGSRVASFRVLDNVWNFEVDLIHRKFRFEEDPYEW